jgi:hypothetical protein
MGRNYDEQIGQKHIKYHINKHYYHLNFESIAKPVLFYKSIMRMSHFFQICKTSSILQVNYENESLFSNLQNRYYFFKMKPPVMLCFPNPLVESFFK